MGNLFIVSGKYFVVIQYYFRDFYMNVIYNKGIPRFATNEKSLFNWWIIDKDPSLRWRSVQDDRSLLGSSGE